jgi:hypothetical protein
VCPIPGNIIGVGVVHIARRWWRDIGRYLVNRSVVDETTRCRPKRSCSVSPMMMPRRERDRRRSRASGVRCCRRGSRPGKRLVCVEAERYEAERRDKRPMYSMRHGRHPFVIGAASRPS